MSDDFQPDELTTELLRLAKALDDDDDPVCFDGNLARDAALEIVTLRKRLSEAQREIQKICQQQADADNENDAYAVLLHEVASNYMAHCPADEDATRAFQHATNALRAALAKNPKAADGAELHRTSDPRSDESAVAGPASEYAVADPDCICRGNWRSIVKKAESMIGKQFLEERNGKVWRFFGVVHGDDDYYYGMSRPGELCLASCVGSLEVNGFTLVESDDARTEEMPSNYYDMRFALERCIRHIEMLRDVDDWAPCSTAGALEYARRALGQASPNPFLPAMEAVCKALDAPQCERCGDTRLVTRFGAGEFGGDSDDQPCPECKATHNQFHVLEKP
jgi:hypothetical protein